MRIVEYGRTWENRPLVYVVIASEENFARLDTIKQGMARLADPRRIDGDDADALIRDLPAVVWLGYGIHGDEISSTDAALYTAYHLLAARDDEIVRTGLESAVVVIDPSQNPDGRNRFVQSNRAAVGNAPSSSPIAAERDQPWPGGRANHYLFDLNRDLIALTQPESRARVKALLEWYPLVVVDAHEMGAESTYFFPPNAEPSNPHITSAQQAALELFGRNNARWFDRFGFEYFTREVFDFFYPGYADTWATFQGGVGMTYEQASARGLEVKRPGGSRLTYADGVRHHFVASMSTIETAAKNRERLLRDFWAYRSSAVDEGRRGSVREHVLPRRGDVSLVDELGRIAARSGNRSETLDARDLGLPPGASRRQSVRLDGAAGGSLRQHAARDRRRHEGAVRARAGTAPPQEPAARDVRHHRVVDAPALRRRASDLRRGGPGRVARAAELAERERCRQRHRPRRRRRRRARAAPRSRTWCPGAASRRDASWSRRSSAKSSRSSAPMPASPSAAAPIHAER